MSPFFHGFILALGLILPLGPQNVFVLSQGATQPKFRNVLPVVLTAAICDTFLILLAVLGVSLVVLSIAWIKIALVIFGVGFLIYMGWLTWRSTPAHDDPKLDAKLWPAKRQIVFAASVSLLNPHAILDTIGVIGTSSLAYLNGDKVAFTLACIFNSWLWFFGLAIVGRFVGSIGVVRKVLNKVSAVIMWISAIYLVYNLIVIA